MSRRTHTWNAWQSAITAELAAGASSVSVPSIPVEFQAPMYLVIEPDQTGQKEWVRADTINGNTFENLTRNLDGSDGDLTHPINSVIRLVISKQHLDDIFLDIIDNTQATTDHEADSGDPHAAAGYLVADPTDFVAVVGDTMTGTLSMSGEDIQDVQLLLGPAAAHIQMQPRTGQEAQIRDEDGTTRFRVANVASGDLIFTDLANVTMLQWREIVTEWRMFAPLSMQDTNKIINLADPTADQDAATKVYVDGVIAGGSLPSGTRMVFDQDAAPTGWTRDTSDNDRMIRIVSGARADGGTWTQPGHTHTNPTTASTGAHTHTGPSHTHTNPQTGQGTNATAIAQEDGGSNFEYNIKAHSHAQGNTGAQGTGSTSSTGSHGHTQGATGSSATANSWRPLHRDMIVAVKD